MYAVILHQYQLQLSLMWHQDNPMDNKSLIIENFNDIHLIHSYEYWRSL